MMSETAGGHSGHPLFMCSFLYNAVYCAHTYNESIMDTASSTPSVAPSAPSSDAGSSIPPVIPVASVTSAPAPAPQGGNKTPWVTIIVSIAILGLLAIAALYFWGKQVDKTTSQETQEDTSAGINIEVQAR